MILERQQHATSTGYERSFKPRRVLVQRSSGRGPIKLVAGLSKESQSFGAKWNSRMVGVERQPLLLLRQILQLLRKEAIDHRFLIEEWDVF